MFPLVRQVQIACDFAKGVCARLAGIDVPAYDDKEATFEELRARIATTIDFINSLDATRFDGSETREITLRPAADRGNCSPTLSAGYGLPQSSSSDDARMRAAPMVWNWARGLHGRVLISAQSFARPPRSGNPATSPLSKSPVPAFAGMTLERIASIGAAPGLGPIPGKKHS